MTNEKGMTNKEAIQYLNEISWDIGTTNMENLTEKDGEKMREAIKVIESHLYGVKDYKPRNSKKFREAIESLPQGYIKKSDIGRIIIEEYERTKKYASTGYQTCLGNFIYWIHSIPDVPIVNIEGELFTDDEKRMFLASLAREQRVCEQIDIEYPNAKIKLAPIIHSIKEKVLRSSLWKEVEE